MWYLRFAVYIFVIIIIFTGVLYLWILELFGLQIDAFKTDFLSFIPLAIRLPFFMIILWLSIGTVKVFSD